MRVFLVGFGKGAALGLAVLAISSWFEIPMGISHWVLIYVIIVLSGILDDVIPI